jgi:hypothetical protein
LTLGKTVAILTSKFDLEEIMQHTLIAVALIFSGIAFGSDKATFTAEQKSLEVSNKSGSLYVCNWNTTSSPANFVVNFSDDGGDFFVQLYDFRQSLLEIKKRHFDMSKDDSTGLSWASFENKGTQIAYNMLNVEEHPNCVVDVELVGLDVVGKVECNNMAKWNGENIVGSGIEVKGTFRCPYSAS